MEQTPPKTLKTYIVFGSCNMQEQTEYLEEIGADVDGMTDEELEEASEVFALPDGKYLIVEG